MYTLTDAEKALPRRDRRAILSKRRTKIRKKVPFGRIKALAVETGQAPQDDRIVYRHHTRGLVDRRITDELVNALMVF